MLKEVFQGRGILTLLQDKLHMQKGQTLELVVQLLTLKDFLPRPLQTILMLKVLVLRLLGPTLTQKVMTQLLMGIPVTLKESLQ